VIVWLWLKTKAWPWLKRNWKWVVFPIGILMAIATASAVANAIKNFPPPDDLDEETQAHLKRLRTADRKRNEALVELETKKHEQLKGLSQEQNKELEQLRSAPTEEVVSWFDSL